VKLQNWYPMLFINDHHKPIGSFIGKGIGKVIYKFPGRQGKKTKNTLQSQPYQYLIIKNPGAVCLYTIRQEFNKRCLGKRMQVGIMGRKPVAVNT